MASSKITRIIGWVLSVLLAVFLIGLSASGKFTEWPGKDEMFGKMGFNRDIMFQIGIVEVIVTLLFLVPQTAFIGAILLTGYLGGAVVTHWRVGDPVMNTLMPVIMGVVAWVALGLRKPAIFSLALGRDGSCHKPA